VAMACAQLEGLGVECMVFIAPGGELHPDETEKPVRKAKTPRAN